MLFNSFVFIFLFLPIVCGSYYLLLSYRRVVSAKILLIIASLFFYSWWSVNYLPILIFSLIFNFLVGDSIQNNQAGQKAKVAFFFGVFINLCLLGYFKYADFFIDNLNTVFEHDIGKLDPPASRARAALDPALAGRRRCR